jgi:drug/metabolite transporter (DMT)-like permease
MPVILLTALAMCAFAANSVLNRMAVGAGLIDPMTFAIVRLFTGAAALAGLVIARRMIFDRPLWPGWAGRVPGVLGLFIYLIGFSLAYVRLDAGAGALILFGAVQVTMFAGALLAREAVPSQRWAGAALAFGGLVVLLLPGGATVSLPHAGAMVIAGAGFGVYSLAGRGAGDPLGATAANFVLALPLALCAMPWVPLTGTAGGLGLAAVSGIVTSGMGYALWYRLVPRLGAARAAVAQLTVPVIAAGAGIIILHEPVSLRFVLAAAMVLGGVALASVQSARVIR